MDRHLNQSREWERSGKRGHVKEGVWDGSGSANKLENRQCKQGKIRSANRVEKRQ